MIHTPINRAHPQRMELLIVYLLPHKKNEYYILSTHIFSFQHIFYLILLLPSILSAAAGDLKWEFSTIYQFRYPPAVGSDETIYIISGRRSSSQVGAPLLLYAVNNDGSQKWMVDTGEQGYARAVTLDLNNSIYFTCNENISNGQITSLYAYNPDGSQKWSYPLAENLSSTVGIQPTIDSHGNILVGVRAINHESNGLYAISSAGQFVWQFDINRTAGFENASVTSYPPAVGLDGTIYLIGNNLVQDDDGIYQELGLLVALNPDGTLQWTKSFVETLGRLQPLSIGPDGTLYLSTGDGLYALHLDGSVKWSYPSSGNAHSTPVVDIDGTIYWSLGNLLVDEIWTGGLKALSPDGNLKWERSLTVGNYSYPPAIGLDITLDNDRTVYSSDGQAFDTDGNYRYGSSGGTHLVMAADGTLLTVVGNPPYSNSRIVARETSSVAGPAPSSWPMVQHDARHSGFLPPEPGETISLSPGQPVDGMVSQYQIVRYSYEAEVGRTLLVELVPGDGLETVLLDASQGTAHLNPREGEVSTDMLSPRGTYEFGISPIQNSSCFISLFGYAVASGGGSYTITARYINEPYLIDISPRESGNSGTVTLRLSGLGFTESSDVSLLGAGSFRLLPEQVIYTSATELYATFDMQDIRQAYYDVRIDTPGEPSSTLEDVLKVGNGFENIADGFWTLMVPVLTNAASR